MKFASKRELGKDYVVPPLEGLWWADDPADFVARRKDRWRWTMMIMVPDFVGPDLYEAALAKTRTKLGEPPDTLRLESLTEGLSLQTLHIGSYDDEGPILAHLHDELMPAEKLDFNGRHHEIYLSDPRKTPPGKLKTILRQPVKAARVAASASSGSSPISPPRTSPRQGLLAMLGSQPRWTYSGSPPLPSLGSSPEVFDNAD